MATLTIIADLTAKQFAGMQTAWNNVKTRIRAENAKRSEKGQAAIPEPTFAQHNAGLVMRIAESFAAQADQAELEAMKPLFLAADTATRNKAREALTLKPSEPSIGGDEATP